MGSGSCLGKKPRTPPAERRQRCCSQDVGHQPGGRKPSLFYLTEWRRGVPKNTVVKLVTFDPVLRAVTEIGEGSRGLTAGLRLNCSSRGLVSLGVVSVVESCV
ncbi:hypothetical protein ElyMa_002673200 [Elysia marginata]|uniref:Uncharacterized protein n=1 Tax=Elysia marginata TaxID=1093978 RepID=A0AAV4HAB2_9GAST|nr:hypothetical protein ElyMa_002673200 [Elysia marginata]